MKFHKLYREAAPSCARCIMRFCTSQNNKDKTTIGRNAVANERAGKVGGLCGAAGAPPLNA